MSKKSFSLLFLIALFCMAAAISWQRSKIVAPKTLPLGTLTIKQVVFQVEIAATPQAIKQGLSGREALARKQGMYFIYPSAHILRFWMKEMRFPLDIIWIKDNVVIGISANIPVPLPNTSLQQLKIYPSPQPANRVLEVTAGTAATYQLKIGDPVVFQPLQPLTSH